MKNITGKEIHSSKLNVTNALSLFNLDTQSGIYFIKLTSNNKTIIKKLVVQQ